MANSIILQDNIPPSSGMFISLTYSAPVLVNCVLILVNWFLASGDLLVTVKRGELKERVRREGGRREVEEETKKSQ